MDSVFILWHVHEISDNQEDEKLIGVYRTEADAQAAIVRVQNKPGFKDTFSGFQIVVYELNKDHWTDGYATV